MTDGYGRDADREVDAADVDAEPHRVDVEGATGRASAGADAGADRGAELAGAHPEEVDRQFDWRGWTLVGAIVVSFLVIPAIIVLYPHVGSALGLSFWDTYLVLPLIPAVVLALLAVWATTRP